MFFITSPNWISVMSHECRSFQSHSVWAGSSGEADHRPAGKEVGQPEEKIQGRSNQLDSRDKLSMTGKEWRWRRAPCKNHSNQQIHSQVEQTSDLKIC